MTRLIFLWVLVSSSLIRTDRCEQSPATGGYLTQDGAWCWFSDPRAIVVDDRIITGWVKADGSIEAASFDPQETSIQTEILNPQLEKDDHDNPAFVITAEGKVIAMYTKHSKTDIYQNTLTAEDSGIDFSEATALHPMDEEELKKFPRKTVTYANPYRLEAEDNRLYCFGRWTGFKPNMMWSDDHGKSWSKSKVFITNYPFDPSNRPYVKYHSDGKSKIHMVFTDGHPRVEPTNSVYYAYYENGAFFRADDTRIADMSNIPFEPRDASVIYKSNKQEGRAWIADIGQDEQGYPVVLYTKSPDITDHRYVYARYDGKQWHNHEICASGKWFPQTPEGQEERETHYFGNLTVHPNKANVIYLSRQIDGVFEIERRQTRDGGKSWSIEPVTQNSTYDNVRPYVPRGLFSDEEEMVLWMENRKYIHYTDYDSAIKYWVRKSN